MKKIILILIVVLAVPIIYIGLQKFSQKFPSMCEKSCVNGGFKVGDCLWKSEAVPCYLEDETCQSNTVFEKKWPCFVIGSAHCGQGQCSCYCWDN